jgi:hypothetical protein
MKLLISLVFAFIFGGMVWWAAPPISQQIIATMFGAACGFLIAYCGIPDKDKNKQNFDSF